MKNMRNIFGGWFWILIFSFAPYANGAIEKGQCDGYFIFETNSIPETYNGGFSTYIAAWPLLANYPGSEFQSGLPGTWMSPQYLGVSEPQKNYTDIEGGMGWWNDTRFATIYPKFIMGAVASEFSQVTNGPSTGWGTWDEPAGKYSVAQLSNRLLWPPDGLNLKQGTNGELFGYGYLPLPLTEPKSTTAGFHVPTGNNNWTLFLNTKSFKGPVTFVLPIFWSLAATTRSDLVGMGLDTRPSIANYPIQMETQYTPAAKGIANNGEIYARLSPTQFPHNFGNQSALMHNFTSYNKTALWDKMKIPLDANAKDYTLPEYYHLSTVNNKKMWVPVLAKNVPTETGLTQYQFPPGKQNNSTPYTTPTEATSRFKSPGPKAGPFTATLGDSSLVTYYWYRFAEQPAMLNNGLSVAEREKMQASVEKIHTNWTKDNPYLPSPTLGIELADLDPGLIVTPPAGMESGYVPIVTRQEKAPPGTGTRFNRKLEPQFSFQPNQLVFSVSEAGTYTIAFSSLNGNVAARLKDIVCEKGTNTVPVNRLNLHTGIYIARIHTKSSIHSWHRVMIQN